MSTIRVTVASNLNQSQKASLLIPPPPSSSSLSPQTPPSHHSLITEASQTKLRLKEASRIFEHYGREFTQKEDWQGDLKDDVTLVVSWSEEYVS